jgi:hypothetical protein
MGHNHSIFNEHQFFRANKISPTIKLEDYTLWSKGGSNKLTKAYGQSDHQETARSKGTAGKMEMIDH